MRNFKWFGGISELDAAKRMYRELLKKHHPDHGGSEEICKEIVAEFEAWIEAFMADRFHRAGDEKTADFNYFVFADILKKIIDWNIRIEIIGFWIYAFESYELRAELAALGFWFSKKHRAWVYNGGSKVRYYTNLTTNGIRNVHGCTVVREKVGEKKEEKVMIEK